MTRAQSRFALAMLGLMCAPLVADDKPAVIAGVNDHDTVWNRFVEAVHALHQRQLKDRTVQTTETIGDYHGFPGFYREIKYRDATSGLVLSTIQWEREHPERIHSIEVNVYGADGRLLRDYMGWYLPNRRSVPRATAINLYHYGDGMRGWRQFDASGERTYEKCSAWRDGKGGKTLIELGDEKVQAALANPHAGVMVSDLYRRCFGGLPDTAGEYLTPQ